MSRTASLKDLIAKDELVGDLPVCGPITMVTSDSRQVIAGALFFALPGTTINGEAFIEKALMAGAGAIVLAPDSSYEAAGKPVVRVKNIRRAFALAAAAFNDYPAKKMKVVAITGTNGKTTTTYLLESIAKAAGKKVGVIGTVSYRIDGKNLPSSHTTPPADYLQNLLREMVEAGVEYLFMEVSSHALDQYRVDGITFTAAGFSNLTQDHLDYHHDLESYFAAKKRLFTDLKPTKGVAINIDDAHGAILAAQLGQETFTVSATNSARVHGGALNLSIKGIKGPIFIDNEKIEIDSPLMGQFNLDNILMASALAHIAGFSAEEISRGINKLALVPGRLEQVRVLALRQPTVLVDYAHTPDALARALACVRSLNPERLICVFGCGGDRDNTKRPIMGREVAEKADLAVVTSDNPRTEDPLAIIEMIMPGVVASGKPKSGGLENGYLVESDRAKAIHLAIRAATPRDIVLIAGKGHEDYQIIGHEKHHFSDQEVALSAIKEVFGSTAIDLAAALPALSAAEVVGTLPKEVSGVATDSRKAGAGELFVALKGDNFDGHAFVEQALSGGFAAALVNKSALASLPAGLPLIVVPDTLVALGELANWYRREHKFTIVGLTGSVGKTTTKEMLAAALGTPYKTQGNLNNHIGVPLSLLSLPHGAELAVIEMGTSGPGEIARLAAIAEPDLALITNIRPVHLEGLGSLQGIAHEKGAIFRSLKKSGVALVNISEPFIPEEAKESGAQKVVTYAADENFVADVALLALVSDDGYTVTGRYRYGKEELTITLPIPGKHNLVNCTAALAAAYALNIPAAKVASGLTQMSLPKGRLAVKELAGYTVIDDTYNANPAAIKASATTLLTMAKGAKVALVLGHMGELGASSDELHKELGLWISDHNFDYLFTVGEKSFLIAYGALQGKNPTLNVCRLKTHEEAAQKIKELLPKGTFILVKGSRSAHMENVLQALAALAAC